MLAEGFLSVLWYREERKLASTSKISQTQAHLIDHFNSHFFNSESTARQRDSDETDPNQEESDPAQFQGLKVEPQAPVSLSIPRCPPVLAVDPDFTVFLENCSLLDDYPDLQVADSGPNPLRASITQHSFVSEVHGRPECSAQQQQQDGLFPPILDQGYLAMAGSVNASLDLPGSGLEPMSNSVLNGLLDKQLEQVYMQHLTDNLARCNSHLGNSILHDLVPPPQPICQLQGPDSLDVSLEEGSESNRGKKMSYLSTQNLVPCSSNFSSPVLRISEADTTHLH